MERLTILDIAKKLISSNEYDPDVQWCLSELRDILEIMGDMSSDRLREIIEADRGGRCVVLQSQYAETTGVEALRRAMYVCAFTNNEVKRYTADAIAEKVVREAKKALEEMEERKDD